MSSLVSWLEECNLATNTYFDVDFDNFTKIIKKADGATTRLPERVLARKIVVSNMIGAISEGILRIGALYILSDLAPSRSPVHDPLASKEYIDDLSELFDRKLNSVFTQVNIRVEHPVERHDKEALLGLKSSMRIVF